MQKKKRGGGGEGTEKQGDRETRGQGNKGTGGTRGASALRSQLRGRVSRPQRGQRDSHLPLGDAARTT
ncbi:hypothetical protein, partial [Tolypothrix sp. VBCCA 56010]|uniref:hypothetical protein n=1 Tax=Tolypothrix sp. VBCCA 56010 TaxID=3137731 RepID=UPI003D7D9AE4